MIRPRLTDHFGVHKAQIELEFAIPLLTEDVPLYVDPFLLWKSPSFQDKALHNAILNGFNHVGWLARSGKRAEALTQLVVGSECEEVGLGVSAKRKGSRIGKEQAGQILSLFEKVPQYSKRGFIHFEEIQFFVSGISKDRISDFACSFMKSFLIDFTVDQCEQLGIPLADVTLSSVYELELYSFVPNVRARLPVNPETRSPVLLVPKRWLRFRPWLDFDEYFRSSCPLDDEVNPDAKPSRVHVLQYNRENYGAVEAYVKERERVAADCRNDPLFQQIPVVSAKRAFSLVGKLPTGKDDNADRKYEHAAAQLLASLLYPHLDFADEQSRTDSGVSIRDLIFYNNRGHPFLRDVFDEYASRQLVFELKNVKAIEREHINQLNRYLGDSFGNFGVLVTRHDLPRAMVRNTVDLWGGKRHCIIALTDADIAQMVEVYESKQRAPIDVVSKKYAEFRRQCPS
jgi:hypothetical protein